MTHRAGILDGAPFQNGGWSFVHWRSGLLPTVTQTINRVQAVCTLAHNGACHAMLHTVYGLSKRLAAAAMGAVADVCSTSGRQPSVHNV